MCIRDRSSSVALMMQEQYYYSLCPYWYDKFGQKYDTSISSCLLYTSDAWAAIFTKKTADYELNVTGSIKRKKRFRTYIKVPELAMFLREITDYRTADMTNLDVPEKNVRFLSHAPTIEQEEMIGRLVSFAGSGN